LNSQPSSEEPLLGGHTVAVLGSARLMRDSPEWKLAHHLGNLLGLEGAVVITGGYAGLMGAVAEGARAAGAETVGLPMAGGSHPQPDPAHVIWHRSYGDRLDHRASADAVVVLCCVGIVEPVGPAPCGRLTESACYRCQGAGVV
jgi:predicted Rossmann-fold nucleotide-binding protein